MKYVFYAGNKYWFIPVRHTNSQ